MNTRPNCLVETAEVNVMNGGLRRLLQNQVWINSLPLWTPSRGSWPIRNPVLPTNLEKVFAAAAAVAVGVIATKSNRRIRPKVLCKTRRSVPTQKLRTRRYRCNQASSNVSQHPQLKQL